MGCDSEHIVLPKEVTNVGMLLDWLSTMDQRFNSAFEYIDVVLVSVNLHYADRDYPVQDADEVILSPPIAGG
ncbi:MAG: MoaD/ThiS family protein [Betaproteobacteria bacterium]|nr:MoaD/ThiS family protein [Betaproteobacteria bacterium]